MIQLAGLGGFVREAVENTTNFGLANLKRADMDNVPEGIDAMDRPCVLQATTNR